MIQIIAQRGGMVYPSQPIQVPSITGIYKNFTEILAHLPADEHVNLFYTLAHHSGIEGASLPQRTAATFAYQTILAWDIDAADTSRPLEYAGCVAQVLDCPVTSLTVIDSGNGVHIIAGLKANCTIRSSKFFKEFKPAYSETCYKIARLMQARELPGKVDPSIFDPARVLRLPGTKNVKPGKDDKECRLVQVSEAQLELDLAKVSGLAQAQDENISPIEVRRQFPNPDFEAMYQGCDFIKWAHTSPGEVHEPNLFDLLSLLVNVQPAAKITAGDDELTARELGQKVFQGAVNSPSLAKSDFTEKWDQSARYGCRKCSAVDEHWGGCSKCPNFGKVPTPLALKGDDHIGSAASGYWVMNSKGHHTHPNYADLAKVFVRERSYVANTAERILAFNGTHYTPIAPIEVKAWLERKVRPVDPLRETHRNEFLAKIKAAGNIAAAGEAELFERAVHGKLNCKNGVLDIVTGDFLPHAPSFGFQNVLPYDYVEGEASEFFLDWLSQITSERTELMESLLDIMAYCLWPSFDDHIMVYFVGEGANGKSTLINVLRAILGQDNVAAVNVSQLTKNRFAPASLEGKLANLSEESSGGEMGSEQLNVLKNLSSGGEMMIERKGEQGYLYRNRAKLIFSANRVPRFFENGQAIRRRLVVIPFDYQITNADSNIERRLVSEAPQILSMLIKRIQTNIAANDGKFIVARGSATHQTAQKEFLESGNSVIEWAQDELDYGPRIPDDVCVTTSSCYAAYRAWCGMNGFEKPENIIVFGRYMSTFILPAAQGTPIKKIEGKTTRVYRRVKFKERPLNP